MMTPDSSIDEWLLSHARLYAEFQARWWSWPVRWWLRQWELEYRRRFDEAKRMAEQLNGLFQEDRTAELARWELMRICQAHQQART